jgi:hypothetical protein
MFRNPTPNGLPKAAENDEPRAIQDDLAVTTAKHDGQF